MIKKLGTGLTQALSNQDSVRSPDSVLNDLVDNYGIISKKEISGISGYVCDKCLTFEFYYINDIGYDLTAKEKHRCIPEMVYEANNVPSQSRKQRLNELRERATLCVIQLANSIFSAKKKLVLESSVTSNIENFHAPKISLQPLGDGVWPWIALSLKKLILTSC